MKHMVMLLFVVVTVAPTLVFAKFDMVTLYDRATLQKKQSRLQSRIETLVNVVRPYLSDEERAALQGVRLVFPLITKQGPTDFAFNARKGEIRFPIMNLAFWEDLSVAYAWLWANEYSLETIDQYVAMLRHRKAKDFRGHRYPPPLRALHIPPDALSDPQVDDLSLRFRNTAFAFILFHEWGHVLEVSFKREFQGDGTLAEIHADRFAMDLMRRTSTIPMGVILWFQANAYYEPDSLTHPMTPARLTDLAGQLTAMAPAYGRDAGNVRFIAGGVRQIATILTDLELKEYMAGLARRTDPSSLLPRRLE